jgi:nitroimidazol reductase NimA-like FMN-containing flavoprotein (pyridoxamine 5'-phosphate oxidase superfamily)
MRRSDREIIELDAMEAIINDAHVCRLGMIDNDRPYIVPLNFGYRNGTFYFHSSREGLKIEILKQGHMVCIEIDGGHELVKAEEACDWGMRYSSVIAYGRPRFIEDLQAKHVALAIIMEQYSKDTFSFPEKAVAATAVFAVDVESMTAKQKN